MIQRRGSGPPLLVINGLAATKEDWDPIFIEGLASRNELLLLDNRGMGASVDDGSTFTIADLAADCARVIVAELGRPTAVLGRSLGGFIAQALALDHPQHVTKLVLLSTGPRWSGLPRRPGCRRAAHRHLAAYRRAGATSYGTAV